MKVLFYTVILSLVIFSCVPECRNTNPIFDRYTPDSQEYMRELKKQLNINVREGQIYSIEGYSEKDRKEFIHLRVQDSKLCAIMVAEITGNKRLENFRKAKGMSYRGAMVTGIGYTVIEENDVISFRLNKLEQIID